MNAAPTSFTSQIDLIRLRAAQAPERRIYTYLADGETEQRTLTYAEVDTQARALAAQLQALAPLGTRVLLIVPSGLDAVLAIVGAQFAGHVPVPVLPPQPGRPPENLLGVLADTQATLALTTQAQYALLQPLISAHPALSALTWVQLDAPSAAIAADWVAPRLAPSDLAALIYTSGSTQKPRGIRVTHGHVMQTLLRLRGTPPDPNALSVMWMPVQHGNGLGSAVLAPLLGGTPVVMLPPQAFLERPARWLEAIARYGATTSGGPNFAYDLCVARTTPAERAALDLSRWRHATVGTGPVHGRTLDAFAEAFAPSGFRREAFQATYGLTEAAVGLASTFAPRTLALDRAVLAEGRAEPAGPADLDPAQFVSAGPPTPAAQVTIVDPATRQPCPPSVIGEIWASAAIAFPGYHNRPEETEATFNARLADGAGPFLRTGDMGGLIDGELFITGRLKDMLIVRGRNYYAEDLEEIAGGAHPALVPGAAAAFALPGPDEEQITLLHEVQPDQADVPVEAVAAAVRRAIAAAYALPVQAVVLVPAGALPRTLSGKIQRHQAKAQYLAALTPPS